MKSGDIFSIDQLERVVKILSSFASLGCVADCLYTNVPIVTGEDDKKEKG
jgi:hypothetical protein